MANRAVLFTPGLWEPGGAAKHARTVATGLADRGWDVRVIARVGSARRPRLRRSPSLTVLEVPGFGLPLVGGALYLGVSLPLGVLWARSAAPCLAMQLTSTSTAASIAATCGRGRFVGLLFSSGRRGELEFVRNSRAWPIRQRLLRRAACLVAQTEFAAAEIARVLPGVPIAVIPTPVEEVEAPSLTGVPRVLFSGRLTEGKGLETLLAAWTLVLEEVPNARLVIAGSGVGGVGGWPANEHRLKQIVSADDRLSQAVEFTGWLDDLSPQLRSCDVYAYPTLSEGMSNALLEACAWGRVVVASDIEANRAVLGSGHPLLVPVGDDRALAAALVNALTSDDLRLKARSCVLTRASRFQASAVISQLEDAMTSDRSTNGWSRP